MPLSALASLTVCGLLMQVPASPAAQSQTPSLADRQQDLLFSNKIAISPGGVPRVPIGILAGQNSVRISAPSGLIVTLYDDVEKELHLPPKAVAEIRIISATPARLHVFPVLSAMPYGDRELRAKELARLKETYQAVRLVTVGAINGFKGRVLDNRQWLFLADGPGGVEWAKQEQQRLARQHGLTVGLHEILDEKPRALLRLEDGAGRAVGQSTHLVRIRAEGKEPLLCFPPPPGGDDEWRDGKPREYDGELLVTAGRDGRLTVVNRVSLTRYLIGVVPAETYAGAPPEALKAQAVAARSHVLARLGTRHLADPFQLCARQHCQVYQGRVAENQRTTAAIKATKGEVLFNQGQLVDAVYSSNSGGYTENNEIVWPQAPSPALRGHGDGVGDAEIAPPGKSDAALRNFIQHPPAVYAARSSFNRPEKFRWRRELGPRELTALGAKLKIGRLQRVAVLERGVSGRVTGLKLSGTRGSAVVLHELPVRQILGDLPSGLFLLDETRSGGQLARVTLRGAGWGHGVGMCQTGAIGRAEAGQDYQAILRHYYNGAGVEKLY